MKNVYSVSVDIISKINESNNGEGVIRFLEDISKSELLKEELEVLNDLSKVYIENKGIAMSCIDKVISRFKSKYTAEDFIKSRQILEKYQSDTIEEFSDAISNVMFFENSNIGIQELSESYDYILNEVTNRNRQFVGSIDELSDKDVTFITNLANASIENKKKNLKNLMENALLKVDGMSDVSEMKRIQVRESIIAMSDDVDNIDKNIISLYYLNESSTI